MRQNQGRDVSLSLALFVELSRTQLPHLGGVPVFSMHIYMQAEVNTLVLETGFLFQLETVSIMSRGSDCLCTPAVKLRQVPPHLVFTWVLHRGCAEQAHFIH